MNNHLIAEICFYGICGVIGIIIGMIAAQIKVIYFSDNDEK